MPVFDDLKMYSRFGLGLPGFLRRRITPAEAEDTIRHNLGAREENFLKVAERTIYGRPESPYLALLRRAGCELGDLRSAVRTRGLESTLSSLHSAGVHVTLEEFKGRTPIRRPGFTLEVQAKDFDNPSLRRHYYSSTGGSTGVGTRLPTDLEHLANRANNLALLYTIHNLWGVPSATWRGLLPDHTGIGHMLRSARVGQFPRRWFTPLSPGDLPPSLKYRVLTHAVVATARACGAPLPWPEPVPLDRAEVIARWMAETLRAEGRCLMHTNISRAVRIGVAAQREGLDLRGATFIAGSEPPTAAKVASVTATGARHLPTYAFGEAGGVAFGCGRGIDTTDVHLALDGLALHQVDRQVVAGEALTVPAFCFTGLLPTTPKILLNVETDDYGIVEERSCGCPAESFGFRTHLRQIHSYRKLTGEGVRLVGSMMLHILEDVLPAKFGGSSVDYQLEEEEDESGLTRLFLVVSPRIALQSEADVIRVVLDVIGRDGLAGEMARAVWTKAGTFRVRRGEPTLNGRGKLFPLHLKRLSQRDARETAAP